jgi:flavin prenyltransferase
VRVLLGISGASGAVYGVRTGTLLLSRGVELHVLATAMAWSIMAEELPGGPAPAALTARKEWLAKRMEAPRDFRLHAEDDFRIPFASGSNPPDAVIVAPCSMGTLGRIAHGIASTPLTRCADVALKERKPLVLVPRETPLSLVHLENMAALARAGAVILPACPGFYNRPATVGELVDFVAARILSRIGLDAGLLPRWGEPGGRRKKAGKGDVTSG